MDAEIDAAVDWWVGVLRSPPSQDNGDAAQSLMGDLVRGLYLDAKPISESQLQAFGESLRQRLREYLSRPQAGWQKAKASNDPSLGAMWRTFGVDYGPDPILWEAAEAVGITGKGLLWPWKTMMWIHPGQVRVARGYRAPIETIFEAPASAATELGQG